ncbi:MAG: molecular chaperone HtpG, partial [Pseudomonadota bacterium]|nr:molecular chaperone HtpG [Pseudomonadota bacterium]
ISLPIRMDKESMGEDEKKDDKEIVIPEEETVNSASALWIKSKSEIDDDAYNEFYKHVAHDFQDPLARVHSRVEGTNEYTMLLYVPSRAPFDLWDRDAKHGVKLYVHRIFIMDDAEQLMPRYLRFIRGVIDSDSLPLNVSREILQQNKQIESIRAGAVKKVLGLIEGLVKNDPEQFQTFWKEFGRVLKEGPIEDFKNKDRIAKLLRFSSTQSDVEAEEVSLEDYIGRMKEDQDKIYYITAESYLAARNSPHLEIFRKNGIEVLLLSDRVDEWLISHLTEFDGKNLQSVAKGELDLGGLDDKESEEQQKKTNEDHKDLIERVKKILGDHVSDVRVTNRLTESAACLVTESYGMSLNMERIMKEAGQEMPGAGKPIFEINPEHALVLRLKQESENQRFEDLTRILFDQALLSEGGQLDDPAAFVHKLNALLQDLLT